jgi:hypothetical protein
MSTSLVKKRRMSSANVGEAAGELLLGVPPLLSSFPEDVCKRRRRREKEASALQSRA